MSTAPLSTDRAEAPLFSDGVGDRVIAADGATGELLQILKLRPALTAVPSFEFALRERTARLANFRHAYYARVRRIDRIAGASGLAIVSDHVEGTRLSDLLRVAEERQLQLDINTALCLVRQLVPAVALLHENARDAAHGLIAPERIVVTPHARVVLVEHVLASAIEQLQFGRERLWQEFRIAMPPSAGLARFDHRADVTGIGIVALSLILGRPMRADEFPHGLPSLLNSARERSALGDEVPLSAALKSWLARALQLDVRRAFASGSEALGALDEVMGDGSMYVATPVALETFMSRYIAALLEPPPVPPPAPVIPISRAQAPAAAVSSPVPPLPVTERPSAAAPVSPEMPPAATRPPIPSRAPLVGEWAIDASDRNARREEFDWPVTTLPRAAAPVAPAPAATPAGSASRVPAPAAPVAATTPVPEPVARARDITELIPASELDQLGLDHQKPLFDPDSPFTLAVEPQPAAEPEPKSTRSFRGGVWLLLAVLVLAAGGGTLWFTMFRGAGGSAPAGMGTLVVQSNPPGVQVFVDGVERGMTPARLSVPAGAHILELRGRGVPRVIPLQVAAGAQLSQYLEFAQTPTTGQLQVESQPAGAKVIVDGVERGVAPLTVADLTPGAHEVILQNDAASARHVVHVQAGATASLVAPVGAAANGPVSGWVTFKVPFTLEIRENGRLLGTTDTDRIMMAAGRHELELVNESLAYRALRTVQVPAGKVAVIPVALPHGIVNLNASPWAEVWIDGQRVGETPIGNLGVPIGPHEVVFRHPQFGEKRHAISVTLAGPVRVSVDMK